MQQRILVGSSTVVSARTAEADRECAISRDDAGDHARRLRGHEDALQRGDIVIGHRLGGGGWACHRGDQQGIQEEQSKHSLEAVRWMISWR